MADRCNLDCAYCHFQASKAGRDLMSPAVARDAIRAFAAAATARGHARADLSLYGGEPLLNLPAVEAALDEADRLRAEGFDFFTILNTNGTLITAELAARLARASVDVHVSLDGPDEQANARRVNYVGRPSWPAVTAGLARAREAGCAVQINSILTAQTAADLRELIDFVADLGCRQIFMALPDGVIDVAGADARARLLLAARAYARGRGLVFNGPWGIGLRRESRAPLEWPPLNVIVRPAGAAFLPYVPQHAFASVSAALSGDAPSAVEADWARVTADCAACALHERCRGYLKMMVRYHTGDVERAEPECATAREVARLATVEPEFEMVRTTLDLRVRVVSPDEVAIGHSLMAESEVVVSEDVLDVLGALRRGGSAAGLAMAFEADNLRDVFDTLRARGLLAPPGDDTDVRLLDHFASGGAQLDLPPLRLGASNEADLERLRTLAPMLVDALGRLPARLAFADARACVFGAHDAAAFADAIGTGPAGTASGWMAATVFHSIVVVDLDAVDAVNAHGGRERSAAFSRGFTHELGHLALRNAGVRVPVWLEEGLCEHLAGAPAELERLCEAAVRLDEFCRFTLACRSSGGRSHATSLLAFSSAPVDANPGYVLARDLVAYLTRTVGFDALLDALDAAGLRALDEPFTALGRSLEEMLEGWAVDVRDRVASRAAFTRPLRIVARGGRALVYNRMSGGYVFLDTDDPEALERVAGENIDVADAAPILDTLGPADPLVARWRSGVFPSRHGRHLRLALEDACNMGCSYCYEGSRPRRTMTIEVADRAVGAWRDLLRPGDLPRSSIRFFGGEPLLNWPVVKHVLDTAAVGLPHEPRWVVNTNGTLLTDEHVEAFAAKGQRLMVALSMDGVGRDHDRLRVLKNGRGTFEQVDRAARALAAARVPFTLSAVVGDHNRHGLMALAQYVVELRNRYAAPITLSLEPILEHGGDERRGRELLAVYDEVISYCWREGLHVGGKLFWAFDALRDEEGASGHFCAVTNSELSVGPTGELLVCHAIPNSGYGTLDDAAAAPGMPIPLTLQQRTGDRVDECTGCEVEGLCGGGCTAQSVRATGSARGNPGPVFCTLVRGIFRKSVAELLGAEIRRT